MSLIKKAFQFVATQNPVSEAIYNYYGKKSEEKQLVAMIEGMIKSHIEEIFAGKLDDYQLELLNFPPEKMDELYERRSREAERKRRKQTREWLDSLVLRKDFEKLPKAEWTKDEQAYVDYQISSYNVSPY